MSPRRPFRSRTPKRPPRRACRECGAYVYSWTEAPLCVLCTRDVGTEPGWTREARRQETIDRLEGGEPVGGW